MPALATLKPNQKVTVYANPKDTSGNPAQIRPGALGNFSVIYALSPATYLTATPNPVTDGKDAEFAANGPSGQTTVTMTGFKISDGSPITASFTIDVVPEEADHFDPSADAPVAQ
jgi:hypothetical protein